MSDLVKANRPALDQALLSIVGKHGGRRGQQTLALWLPARSLLRSSSGALSLSASCVRLHDHGRHGRQYQGTWLGLNRSSQLTGTVHRLWLLKLPPCDRLHNARAIGAGWPGTMERGERNIR
jgi:hypothetical protein